MLLVFQIVFSAPVMSWIESIGDGWAEGGGVGHGGKWEPKAGYSTHSDSKSNAVFQYVT